MAEQRAVEMRAQDERGVAALWDRMAVDDLVTGYAAAVDDGDWDEYRALFAPEGRADYRSAGGAEGDVETMVRWLTETLGLFFPMRQHLIVNRHVETDGATATVRADYYNPMRSGSAESAAPDFECGGRYAFTARRTEAGWRLTQVVAHEKWRR
ncbi:nuclear transport factor 2 family protein [Streptomyces sp. NPDC054796]